MRSFCLYVLGLILFTPSGFSQTVNSGKIAEGLVDYKASSSVDHTTGIMNYNIPLLRLNQDGYDIPISLNYHARGIKVETKAGELAGLGWALSYGGGIVNRTIRGGFADENPYYGILFKPIPNHQDSLLVHEKKIASGDLDGESDIFSVNIKGGVIRFVITRESGMLVVHPIEKTDVTIACIYDGYVIKGFKITDVQGYVYTFKSSSYSSSFNLSAAAGGSRFINVVTSWYLTTVSIPNNEEIVFEYEDDYLEERGNFVESYIQYGKTKSFPKMDNDSTLNDLLTSYGSSNSDVWEILYQIGRTKDALNSLSALYQPTLGEHLGLIPPSGDLNAGLRADYYAEIEALERQFSDLEVQDQALKAQIHDVLFNMYNTDIQMGNEFVVAGQNNLYPNKMIKRIRTRTGFVEFDYTHTPYSDYGEYSISTIKHKTNTGDLLRTIVFDVNRKGYLKNIQMVVANEKVEQQYGFEYYNENDVLDINAQDYWGYYNGKNNLTLFPIDPFYTFPAVGGGTTCVFSKQASTLLNWDYFTKLESEFESEGADRRPVGSVAMARSLKKVTTLLGGSINFEYEGNEIYTSLADWNIPIGGIRIKRITTNDGINDYLVDYKYKFPLPGNTSVLKSTGRLVEWENKFFAFPYKFRDNYSNQYTDVHVFSEFVDMSAIAEDNSNNGVLYHYVEEVRSDHAATGYKYMAISAAGVGDYRPLFDKMLLAKIEYNAAGKILSVQRNTYITNFSYVGSRTEEYLALRNKFDYLKEGTFNSTIVSLPQIKRGPIAYNKANLLAAYPNYATSNISFDQIVYSIDPYIRIYLPNYAIRTNAVDQTIQTSMQAGWILLPLANETSLFNSDYDTSVGYASANAPNLPDEKAYLYERLLNASGIKPIQTSTEYIYGGMGHLNPTQVKTISSEGNIFLKKIKYAPDYQMSPGTPIALLNISGQKASIIEEQSWQSKDGGTTFKFLGAKVNEYASKVVNGKTYLFVEKEYVANLAAPIDPASLGYTQTVGTNAPYTTLFWEGKNIYAKPDKVNNLAVNKTFSRISEIRDRSGYITMTRKYDPFSSDLLVETQGVDPKYMLAFDFGAYQSHTYYHDRYQLFPERDFIFSKSGFKFSDYPITTSKVSTVVNLDNVQYATELDSILTNFEVNNAAQLPTFEAIPAYAAIRELTYNIAHAVSYNEFIASFLQYKRATVSLSNNDDWTLHSLQNYGVNYPEISAYFYLIDNYFMFREYHLGIIGSFDSYDKVMRSPALDVFPMENDVFGEKAVRLSLDVDSLIAKGIDLDIYQVHQNPQWSTNGSFYYRIKYKDNSFSAITYKLVPVLHQKLTKGELVLSTLLNATNIQSIEFFFRRSDRVGTFLAIPKNTSFTAYSYLPDHSPYLTFDQNGRYTETFYNAALEKHYTADFKNNVLQADSLVYGREETNLKKSVQVVISNLYPIDYEVEGVNIVKVIFDSNDTGASIVKDICVIPGTYTKFEIPEGKYGIVLYADKPIGKLRFGSQEQTEGSDAGSIIQQMILGPTIYDINIRPVNQ